MSARRWEYVVLDDRDGGGDKWDADGVLRTSEGQIRTFDLDRIIDLALERNPAILGAKSVIEQNEGRQIQAGAYPNPTIGGQTGMAPFETPPPGRL